MSLEKCRECGQEISSEADKCPHCGKKPERPPIIKWMIVLIFGAFVFKIATDFNAPEPEPTPEQRAIHARHYRANLYMTALKNALREPDSVVWESVRADDNAETVCIKYRAANGFGGTNLEIIAFANGQESRSIAFWNKHCTQPLHDIRKNPLY